MTLSAAQAAAMNAANTARAEGNTALALLADAVAEMARSIDRDISGLERSLRDIKTVADAIKRQT